MACGFCGSSVTITHIHVNGNSDCQQVVISLTTNLIDPNIEEPIIIKVTCPKEKLDEFLRQFYCILVTRSIAK